MEQCLKKCEKIRATEQMRISLYTAFQNEYSASSPANASSPASSLAAARCIYDAAADAGRRRLRSLDLEAVDNGRYERFGRKFSSSAAVNFREEATSSFEICGVMATKKPKLAAAAANLQKVPPVCSAGKTPSAAELEEFFAEAEEYVQKRFSEKYNYDIVKDVPISGGRYQWVRTNI